jgi:hypothetical protein
VNKTDQAECLCQDTKLGLYYLLAFVQGPEGYKVVASLLDNIDKLLEVIGKPRC